MSSTQCATHGHAAPAAGRPARASDALEAVRALATRQATTTLQHAAVSHLGAMLANGRENLDALAGSGRQQPTQGWARPTALRPSRNPSHALAICIELAGESIGWPGNGAPPVDGGARSAIEAAAAFLQANHETLDEPAAGLEEATLESEWQATSSEAWYGTALQLALEAHRTHEDSLGTDWARYLPDVARRAMELYPAAGRLEVEAALLHKALELGSATLASLCRAGIPPDTIEAVVALTRKGSDTRHNLAIQDWCGQVAATGNLAAMIVTMAEIDIVTATDPRRWAAPDAQRGRAALVAGIAASRLAAMRAKPEPMPALLDLSAAFDRLPPQAIKVICMAAICAEAATAGEGRPGGSGRLNWGAAYREAGAAIQDAMSLAGIDFEAAGAAAPLPDLRDLGVRMCTACGCTDDSACGLGCSWAGEFTCSRCVGQDPRHAAAADSAEEGSLAAEEEAGRRRLKVGAADRHVLDWRGMAHANGQRRFADDGTMLDENGARSIFDDVEQ